MNDSDESVEIKQQVSPFFNVQETITSVYIFDRDRWVEREGERGVGTETETDRHGKGKTVKQKKKKRREAERHPARALYHLDLPWQ